jgi:hypothetical protein
MYRPNVAQVEAVECYGEILSWAPKTGEYDDEDRNGLAGIAITASGWRVVVGRYGAVRSVAPDRTYDVGETGHASPPAMGVALLAALACMLGYAVVGYVLWRGAGAEALSMFAPLISRRVRFLPMTPRVPTSNETQRTYRIACEVVEESAAHGSPYIDTRTGGRRIGATFAVGGALGARIPYRSEEPAPLELEEWYYHVAVDGEFQERDGEYVFDAATALAYARTLREEHGEETPVCVHPYRNGD